MAECNNYGILTDNFDKNSKITCILQITDYLN